MWKEVEGGRERELRVLVCNTDVGNAHSCNIQEFIMRVERTAREANSETMKTAEGGVS